MEAFFNISAYFWKRNDKSWFEDSLCSDFRGADKCGLITFFMDLRTRYSRSLSADRKGLKAGLTAGHKHMSAVGEKIYGPGQFGNPTMVTTSL